MSDDTKEVENFYEQEWAEAGQFALCVWALILHISYITTTEYMYGVRFTKISMAPFWLSLIQTIVTLMFYTSIIDYNFENYFSYELWENTFARVIYTFYHANVCFIDLNWHLLTDMLIFQSKVGVT